MDALSTKELRKRLQDLGKSGEGKRNALVSRYKACRTDDGEEEDGDETPVEGDQSAPHASDNPMTVMVDDQTGNKYMRAVRHKGLDDDGDESWLVKDMHQELKSWGHPGGGHNQLVDIEE